MCFWQQEYTRDFRSLSKYGADGNLYLRIRRTKIFEFLFYSFNRVHQPFRSITRRNISTYFN